MKTQAERPRTAGVDLSDLEFWALPPLDERMAAFARLREPDAPAFFEEQPRDPPHP